MFRAYGKWVAVILAIWLPLFSGNALAVSVAMQAMGGGMAVAQEDEPHAHCGQTAVQSAEHDDPQNASGNHCGTCHLVCCGYLAAAAIHLMEIQPSDRLSAFGSAQFQSFTPALLDPPPLARV